ESWSSLQLPIEGQFDSLYYVLDIKFLNPTMGYVLGFFQMENKIWKTTDGGLSWQTQTTGEAHYLNKLYFTDENNGIAAGGSLGGEIVKTTNGGASWQLVHQDNYQKLSIAFVNPLTGFVGCEGGRIYRTTDGGGTWDFVWSETSLDLTSINFIDASTGFGFGTGSVYTKTTDGGAHWFELPIGIGSSRQYYDSEITPDGTIHAAGSYGAMIRSTDSGTSFIAQPYVTEGYISDIEFINTSTGYAVAGYSGGDILKTTNAGATWVSQITSYIPPIYGIAFTNAETGYLAGSVTLYKTTNGGTNWTNVYTSSTNEIFTDVFFTNENTGYVVGSYGRLLKTTNAGTSWIPTAIITAGSMLSSIFFVNEHVGFAVGDNNSAVKTTDAGISWSPMNVASQFVNLSTVFFSDTNTGYISASNGVYKTTTGGETWFSAGAPAGGYTNIQFRGSFGYAITSGGKIIKTTDAGTSWFVQPTVTTNSLYALYFNSDNFVYAGGLLGTMLKALPTELNPTSVSDTRNEIPVSFSLDQNYPNPFNPSTTIAFRIPQNTFVSLSVYNILGQELATLVSSEMNTGVHEVRWNASGQASGVYFYQLKANGYTTTKRMVLLK
ncbi:MAG: YCF48-related protein, partial [bacterium]